MSFQSVPVDCSELPNKYVWRSGNGWCCPYITGQTVHFMGEEDFAESYKRALREYEDAATRLDALRIIRQKFSEVACG
jgi:hypothetical protein